MKKIDLNCDVGESPEALFDGSEEKIISMISSANIACGGHAGDAHSIFEVMKLCKKYDVGIGAHPSYPDQINFGRVEMNYTPEEISQFVFYQVESFLRSASANGFEVRHVKPHGALYNAAARDQNIALAISRGIEKLSKEFILFGLAGSVTIDVWQNEGFKTAAEAFADRRYENDGSLRSRKYSNAQFSQPKDAAAQAVRIVNQGKVVSVNWIDVDVRADTICVHGDTDNSIEILEEIVRLFDESEILIERINQ